MGHGCLSRAADTGESVRTPVFAPHAVMDEEEACRVIFCLDCEQSGVVITPERALPVSLEEIALRYVGPAVRNDGAECCNGGSDVSGIAVSSLQIGGATG